jgi:hypothetical protein
MGASERGRLRRRLVGLAGLLPSLSAAPAQADPFDTLGAGIFLGYAWGEKDGFEWGLEATATHYVPREPSCSSSQRSGFGPVLRLTALGVSRLALTGAVHGGGEIVRAAAALDGELGGTLAVSADGSRGSLHTGVLFESIMFNAYARQQWLLPSYSMGMGARYVPTFGEPGFCVE